MSFLPTSTVSSAVCLAGLLHPAADRRVRPVSGPRPTRLSTSRTADRPHGRPSLRSVPPSGSRIPCHQGAFPLAVATTRLRRLRACREAVGLRALLHRRVRCTHAALPRRGARCSLGISSMIGLSPAGSGGTAPGLRIGGVDHAPATALPTPGSPHMGPHPKVPLQAGCPCVADALCTVLSQCVATSASVLADRRRVQRDAHRRGFDRCCRRAGSCLADTTSSGVPDPTRGVGSSANSRSSAPERPPHGGRRQALSLRGEAKRGDSERGTIAGPASRETGVVV